MSVSPRVRRVVTIVAAFAVLVTTAAASQTVAQPTAQAQQQPALGTPHPSVPGQFWYGPPINAWGRFTINQKTFSTGWSAADPLQLPSCTNPSPVYPGGTAPEWEVTALVVNSTVLGCPNQRGKLVADLRPGFEGRVALVPIRHEGEFENYPYVCFESRYCFFGHTPDAQYNPSTGERLPAVQGGWGAFIAHKELWAYPQWNFIECANCPAISSPPPSADLSLTIEGWKYGQVSLGKNQPVEVKTTRLKCKTTTGSWVNAPCGRPPTNLTPGPGNPPREGVAGPYIRSITLTYTLTPPPGATMGANSRTNDFNITSSPRATTLSRTFSAAQAPNGVVSLSQDLQFFKATAPGSRYTVTATADVTVEYRRWSWDGVSQAPIVPVRDPALDQAISLGTVNCDGFAPMGSNACQFTVVGGNLGN